MKKKILRIMLSGLIIILSTPFNLLAKAEETYAPFKGSGTTADPYQIASAYDLRLLSELVNDKDTSAEYNGSHYIQTTDIDLNNESFTPISTQIDEKTIMNFYGTYNGNYKKIEGLYVNRNSKYNGLFGRIHGGKIRNLTVSGNIDCPDGAHCGGILGESGGKNSSITNCNFTGKVSGSWGVGGIVGNYWASGNVDGCYFNGDVTCTSESGGYCGGIVGLITNGFADDDYTAGESIVKNCYSVGTVTSVAPEKCGGIIGNINIYGEGSTQFIDNNLYLYTMADTGINGDITIGTKKMTSGSIKTTAADILGSPFVENCESNNVNEGYPIFEWQSTPYQFKGSGTAEDPYRISSKDELKKMRDLVNSNYFGKNYSQLYYIQTADIDLENEIWEPIGTRMKNGIDQSHPLFNGNYNGQYHEIRNLNVNKTGGNRYAGLFGSFHSSKGKYIENLIVYGNVTSDSGAVGGIAGEVVNGGAAIRNCAFIGNVTAKGVVGGITGVIFQNGTVENCYHNGNVIGTQNDVGGIVGQILVGDHVSGIATVKNCYHVGKVISSIDNTYRTGEIVGYMQDNAKLDGEIHISNCYYIKNNNTVGLNGAFDSCDITGISTNLMKKIAEDLGEPFITNEDNTINDGFPVFERQVKKALDVKLSGDTNCDNNVDIADVVILKCYLINSKDYSITEQGIVNADVNNRGNGLNTQDSLAILKYLLKLIDILQ